MVGWAEMPRSPGHVFYDRLQSVLIEGGFDGFAEAACRSYYAARLGAPSVPPGRYFRMHLVGYFEGIDSERGLEWRCSDSLSLREFLRLESRDRVPDHSWLDWICRFFMLINQRLTSLHCPTFRQGWTTLFAVWPLTSPSPPRSTSCDRPLRSSAPPPWGSCARGSS